MASKHKRLPTNVPGDFFVDSGCIDCGTCRWVALGTFDGKNEQSYVREQPQGEQIAAALRAVVACPTGSIGTLEKHDLQPAIESFPLPIDPSEDTGVYHLGFHSRDSFGAASYLIVRERGNVMIDSPRFNKGLVERVQALGGVQTMFLTHRDDVADHDRYAAAFGATVELDVTGGYPYLRNDEVLTERARAQAEAYLGAENVVELPIRMTGEDFSFYSQVMPACFYRLGTGNAAKGITSPVHTPTFDVDEDSLRVGSGLMAWLALQELAHN